VYAAGPAGLYAVRVTAAPSAPSTAPHLEEKPRLRGRFHQGAFFASLPAGLLLFWVAPGAAARIGAVVYWISLQLQFGASAMYHLGGWSEDAYVRMRRLDHSMIFVLIAGTYTPICLVALHGAATWIVLAIVWSGAAVGIVTKLYRVDLHVLSGIMYIGLGWAAVFVLPALALALSDVGMVLVVTGGVLYTLGALVLATHRPNPWPEWFGYHEIWHLFTIAAATSLYLAILLLYLSG
jgi:hemolysin III